MIEIKAHINGFTNYCHYHKKLSNKTISVYCIDLIQFQSSHLSFPSRAYGTMNTETAGNLDFSGLPAFFVTNLLLVQCSI